jgi:hypothetical protein
VSITKNVLITAGLTIGLIAAGGTATAFAATPAAGSGLSVVHFPPFPHPGNPGDDRNDHRGDNWGDRGHRGDRDNRGDRVNRGDRDHRGDRDGVSPEQCRDGGGHVNWDRDRCDGGRFDDRRIQF